jgi:hypothetical protein
MCFSLCKAEQDVWMHETAGMYKHIGEYVDDLVIALLSTPRQLSKHFKKFTRLSSNVLVHFHTIDDVNISMIAMEILVKVKKFI